MQKIPLFIGRKPHQWLPMELLLVSIKRRSSLPIEFHELKHIPINIQTKQGSFFSFFRFLVPQKMGWKGKAIYLDPEGIVLGDIKELFELPMHQHAVLAKKVGKDTKSGHYTDVMLLDTEKLKHWQIEEWSEKINQNPSLYNEFLWGTTESPIARDFGDLPEVWNSQDQLDASTKLIQFKDITKQPWKNSLSPHSELFLKELKWAIQQGEIPLDAIESEMRHGLIYPQILEDLQKVEL